MSRSCNIHCIVYIQCLFRFKIMMKHSSVLRFAVLESVDKRVGKRGVEQCLTLEAIYMSVYVNNKTLNPTRFKGSSVYSRIDSNITTWPIKLSSISPALQNCSLLPSLHFRVMRDFTLLSALSPVVRIFCNVKTQPWTPREQVNNLHCIMDQRTWILFSYDVKGLLYTLQERETGLQFGFPRCT
jgi:hypothetical protein